MSWWSSSAPGSGLRFLGKGAPDHTQIKLNKVTKVVIWKSLVAKGCRGNVVWERRVRQRGEMPGDTEAKETTPPRTNSPQPGCQQSQMGAKKVCYSSFPEIFLRALFFLASWLRSKKRNNRFKLK